MYWGSDWSFFQTKSLAFLYDQKAIDFSFLICFRATRMFNDWWMWLVTSEPGYLLTFSTLHSHNWRHASATSTSKLKVPSKAKFAMLLNFTTNYHSTKTLNLMKQQHAAISKDIMTKHSIISVSNLVVAHKLTLFLYFLDLRTTNWRRS